MVAAPEQRPATETPVGQIVFVKRDVDRTDLARLAKEQRKPGALRRAMDPAGRTDA